MKKILLMFTTICCGLFLTNCTEKEKTWEYHIDMGLSVKWAISNIDAYQEENTGGYFQEGDFLWNDWIRMPDSALFVELVNNTTHEWTTVNNIEGYKFTARNGNSIFLPVTGYKNLFHDFLWNYSFHIINITKDKECGYYRLDDNGYVYFSKDTIEIHGNQGVSEFMYLNCIRTVVYP